MIEDNSSMTLITRRIVDIADKFDYRLRDDLKDTLVSDRDVRVARGILQQLNTSRPNSRARELAQELYDAVREQRDEQNRQDPRITDRENRKVWGPHEDAESLARSLGARDLATRLSDGIASYRDRAEALDLATSGSLHANRLVTAVNGMIDDQDAYDRRVGNARRSTTRRETSRDNRELDEPYYQIPRDEELGDLEAVVKQEVKRAGRDLVRGVLDAVIDEAFREIDGHRPHRRRP